jgi:hypothetical protein
LVFNLGLATRFHRFGLISETWRRFGKENENGEKILSRVGTQKYTKKPFARLHSLLRNTFRTPDEVHVTKAVRNYQILFDNLADFLPSEELGDSHPRQGLPRPLPWRKPALHDDGPPSRLRNYELQQDSVILSQIDGPRKQAVSLSSMWAMPRHFGIW